jgi:hypothetical protein
MKPTISVLGLLVLASFTASAASPNPASTANASNQDSTKAYITVTVATPSQYEPASNELAGGSVVTITKKIVPAASIPSVDSAALTVGDTLPPGSALPNGGTLPTNGSPGQTVSIDTCVPRRSTTTYTFKWVPTPEPGHWEVVKVQNTEVASISCD